MNTSTGTLTSGVLVKVGLLRIYEVSTVLIAYFSLLTLLFAAFDSINLSAFEVLKIRLYLHFWTYGPIPCPWHITYAKLSLGQCEYINIKQILTMYNQPLH